MIESAGKIENVPSRRKVTASYAWALGGQFIGQGFLSVISIWVARLLQPEDYGLWAMAGVFISVCRTAQDVGFESALIQKVDMDSRTLSSAFWFVIGGSLIAMLAAWGLAPSIAWIYHDVRVIPIVRAFAVVFVLIALRTVPFALLARELDFASRTKTELLSATGASSLTLLMAAHGYGVWSLIGGALFSEVLMNFVLFFYCPWRPDFRFNFAEVKPLLRFGIPMTGGALLWQIYSQADVFIVGYLLGPAALGFYSMAQKLSMLVPEKIAAVLNRVNYPVFARLQRNRSAVAGHWLTISEATTWLCAPGLFGLILLGRSFVVVVLTPKWLPAVPILDILCLVALVRSLSIILPNLFAALNHPGTVLTFHVVSAVVLPASFALGAWGGRLIGVSLGWLVASSCIFVLMLQVACRLTEVSVFSYLASLAAPVASIVIMCFIILLGAHIPVTHPFTRLVLQGMTGIIGYCGVGLMLLWKTGRLHSCKETLRELWRPAKQEQEDLVLVPTAVEESLN